MHPKQRLMCVLLGLFIATAPAAAQVPDEFTNLKVLPKDIGKRELLDVMRGFSMALGARCDHCHAEAPEGSEEQTDWASDKLEPKRVARVMMQMADEINDKLLPKAEIENPTRVRCVTCHRGLTDPRSLDLVLTDLIGDKGVDAAIERYGELRDKYYGSGSYDFGVQTLDTVAQKLAQEKKDVDGAIRIVHLNIEQNPESAQPHLLLGQLLAEKGDKPAAIASIKRAIELEPDNRWAKRLLRRLEPSE